MSRPSLTCAAMILLSVATGCSAPLAIHRAVVRDDAPAQPDTTPAQASTNGLPLYIPIDDLSGSIVSIGESTTTNLVARVATGFRRIYPDVKFQATAGLTSIGPPALMQGRHNIVPMSRPLTADEIKAFEKRFGYPPTEIKVAADALAIYVEKRNPLAGLTLEQLDGIFSQTQRRGTISIEKWGQTGLTGDWVNRPITLYGYGRGDGVNQIFRQQVMEGGDYRVSMRFEPAGSSIVQGVASDPDAIGCASVFFAAKRVRAVPVAGADGQFYAPTVQNVREHKYPLSRFHYICLNRPPHQPLNGAVLEFVRFLLSHEGQQIVAADGNIPLDIATVEQGRRMLAN